MIPLTLKPTNGKVTLKEVTKNHPEILNEIENLISSSVAEEGMAIKESLLSNFPELIGNIRSTDNHYKLYESLSTPQKVKLDTSYIYGYSKEEQKDGKLERILIKESIFEDIANLSQNTDLKLLYEGFLGGDPFNSPSNTQTGVPLKKRQSEAELRLIQLIVNSRYNADPFVGNAIDNMSRYIIGSGLRVSVQNEEVDNVIENFLRQTDLAGLFSDFIKTTYKDGEAGYLIKSKVTKGKKPRVDWSIHKVFSEEIRGFETHRENPGKKYAYWREVIINGQNKFKLENKWYADIEYWYQFNTRNTLIAFDGAKSDKADLTKDAVIAWFSHGDKRECRGRVPLERCLRDFRLEEDFRINRAILNYERSKVLYIHSVKQQVNRTKATTEVRKSASPKGGVELKIGPGEDYKMTTANLQAADADVDGLLFLYAAGSGISMPIYILGMRADQQNYSAIKNTDSPFNQMILEVANDFIVYLRKIFKWVIARNIDAGILQDTVTIKRVAKEKEQKLFNSFARVLGELQDGKKISIDIKEKLDAELTAALEDIDIPTMELVIDVVIADAVKPNPLEMAKTAFIERKISMVSSQTLSEKRGYKWPQEVMRMLNEITLGLWSLQTGKGQQDSASSGTGLDSGKSVDSGDGAVNQNAKP